MSKKAGRPSKYPFKTIEVDGRIEVPANISGQLKCMANKRNEGKTFEVRVGEDTGKHYIIRTA